MWGPLECNKFKAELAWPKWKKDVTRHSAATYMLATSSSAAAVATTLGNSETILKRHYLTLVTRADAQTFWKTFAAFKPTAPSAQSPCRLHRPLNPKPPESLALPLSPHPPLLFQYEAPWATQILIDQALVTNYHPPMTYCFTSNMRPITCRQRFRYGTTKR